MPDGRSQTTVSVLDSAARFANWWNRRAEPDDRAVVAEAERRGLIIRAAGLLFLTETGKAFAGLPYGGTMDDTPNYQALDAGRVVKEIKEAVAAERARCNESWRLAIREQGYPELTVKAIERRVHE